MRIGMEKPVLQYLLGIVLEHLVADLIKIVTLFKKLVRIADGDAVNILHDEHLFATVLHVGLRCTHIDDVGIEPIEFIEVARFIQKVGLFEEGDPQLLDHIAQIDHLSVLHIMRKATGKAAHHIDILCHGGTHARTLHLNGNLLARGERCAMNLRQRCAAERMRIDRGEYLLPVDSIDRIERNEHRLKGHGLAFLLKLRECLAIGMGQDLGTR